MNRVLDYLRIKEWIDSKVTMMLGVAAYFICLNNVDIHIASAELVAYFLFLFMFLALSYVYNDYADIESDKKAGKKKTIASVPRSIIWLSFLAMILLGDLPIIFLADNKILCICMIIVITVFGIAYSLPGIRFKERGLIGLIECSFAQRCLPLSLILLFVELKPVNIIMWCIWFVLSFFDGLRYILIHQYIDQDYDRLSGTHTYVADKKMSIRKSIIVLCFVDCIGCTAVLVPLFSVHPVIIAAGVLICVLLELCVYQVINVLAKKDWLVSFDSVPLEFFFNFILPVMFGLCMTMSNLWAGIFVLFIILCCIRAVNAKYDIVAVFFKAKIFRKKGAVQK